MKTHFVQQIRPVELASLFKFIISPKRKVIKHGNFNFFVDTWSDFYWSLFDPNLQEITYDPGFTNFIKSYLKPGDTFIDLGANEGWFSIHASAMVTSTGKIYSIEPQHRLKNVIEKNIDLNQMTNITVIPLAISETEMEIDITLSPSLNSGSTSIIKNSRSKFWKKQKTNTKRLDTLFEDYQMGHVNLIKIDIEGYEFSAIKSMENLLKNKLVDTILVEFHEKQLSIMNTSEAAIIAYFKELGYRRKSKSNIHYFTHL